MSPKTTASIIATLTCATAAFALPQPLIHYQFNDSNTATTTATDSSGNNRNGTIYNYNGTTMVAAALQNATGVSGRPGDYAFNNTGSSGMGGFGNRGGAVNWKSSPQSAIGNLTSMTMSFWIKTEEDVSSGGGARLASLYGANIANFIEVRAQDKGVIRTATTGQSTRDSAENSYATENQWVFVAITFDATATENQRIKFYAGGIDEEVVLVGTGSSLLASIALGNSANLTLGSYFDGNFTGQTPFDGFIDDYRLYGTTSGSAGALSAADLDLIRLQAVNIPEPSSIGLLGGIGITLLLVSQRIKRRKGTASFTKSSC